MRCFAKTTRIAVANAGCAACISRSMHARLVESRHFIFARQTAPTPSQSRQLCCTDFSIPRISVPLCKSQHAQKQAEMATPAESGNKADEILARLDEVLQEVDMDVVTVNQITNKLAEELGNEVYDFKALLKEHINKFTANLAAKDSDETAAQPSNSKRKRELEDDTHASLKILKPSETGGEFGVQLSESRQVRLSKFKGALYISIREWYEKDGAMAPGKGISLQVAQWRDLIGNKDAIAAAIEDGDTDYICKLSQIKQLSVKQYKGKLQVDLREFYEKGGELLPGKKGIALEVSQWEKIVAAESHINAAIAEQGVASAAAKRAKRDEEVLDKAPSLDKDKAGPSTAAAEAATTAGPGQSSELPISLSATRRVDVSYFKGTLYVNIREFYEKDGQQLPGKKGISLSADQFLKLFDASSNLTDALAAQDETCQVKLSGKRKASISVFKGTPMVNIREYYEAEGEEKPGRKGISLPADQWDKLAAGFNLLSDELQKQTSKEDS